MLAGLLLVAQAPRGVLVINNATGYLREFYLKFATYCAQRGLPHAGLRLPRHGRVRVRAAGAGARPHERLGSPGHAGGARWLAARYPALPAFTLGHSVGGQLIGAMPNADAARAHVMIATSTGYWRRQRLPFRFVALAFWKLYGPWMLARRGFVPRGLLWRGAALPPGRVPAVAQVVPRPGALRAAAR